MKKNLLVIIFWQVFIVGCSQKFFPNNSYRHNEKTKELNLPLSEVIALKSIVDSLNLKDSLTDKKKIYFSK